jgi:hypothetical protein
MKRVGKAGAWAPLIALLLLKLAMGAALFWAISVPASAQRAADALPPSKAESGVPLAIGGGGGLIVGGVEVDTTGKTDIEARLNGWREAQRLAWPALWNRMSGQPASTAPRLADGALDGMVSAIEVEREQLGGRRYIARLAVVFDRARAATYLGRYAALASSPPFLLMPVLQDAAVRMGHEPDSPWLAAWARLRAGESPIDYVRIQPTPGDVILLSAWAAERRSIRLWRQLIDRYAVADVLIPELILDRTVVNGPVTGLLIVRFGPTGREIGRIRLTNRAGNVAGLMDEAVRQADRLYVAALRAGNLLPDPALVEPELAEALPEDLAQFGAADGLADAGETAALRVRVASPDDATLAGIERAIRGTPGVTTVRTASYVLGGDSIVELSATLSIAELRFRLDRRGLRLVEEPGGWRIRQRLAEEAPLAPPAPAPALEPVLEEAAPPGPAAPPPPENAPAQLLPGG